MATGAAAPENGSSLRPLNVPPEGVQVPLFRFLPPSPFGGQAVRVFSSEGSFNMQLLPGAAPATVRNFLSYVDSGAYRNMLVHRSDPGFVIQTGALTLQGFNLA
ncbi:MAG: peptidylprolyl isomerase, partial [Sphaerospermopsis kisseleviana]